MFHIALGVPPPPTRKRRSPPERRWHSSELGQDRLCLHPKAMLSKRVEAGISGVPPSPPLRRSDGKASDGDTEAEGFNNGMTREIRAEREYRSSTTSKLASSAKVENRLGAHAELSKYPATGRGTLPDPDNPWRVPPNSPDRPGEQSEQPVRNTESGTCSRLFLSWAETQEIGPRGAPRAQDNPACLPTAEPIPGSRRNFVQNNGASKSGLIRHGGRASSARPTTRLRATIAAGASAVNAVDLDAGMEGASLRVGGPIATRHKISWMQQRHVFLCESSMP